ncbi:MAG: sigma-54 dependent transcriptional regulator [Oligoflexia bacterium]|nr:sigma-54 dependent transcriptional regulator [Oligoflexia bacterium]
MSQLIVGCPESVSKNLGVAIRGQANVLIAGPTGSGKSHLARKIHDGGNRAAKPFVSVNLATLHDGTFESELFGHEKGAFTGADSRRVGRLEMAQGGTVFLDEVGELPLRLQARLLEFLQSRTIVPVGGNREIRLDVRVIAATNRDLGALVARGLFREDLFHRLRVVALALPSLSQRWKEFDAIIHDCLAAVLRSSGKRVLGITSEVAKRFELHSWPGNFRELNNVLEYAVTACESDEITVADLPDWFETPVFSEQVADAVYEFELSEQFAQMDYLSAMARFEKGYLNHRLDENLGRVNKTARNIGLHKTTLIRRMRLYGLRAAESRLPEQEI